MEGRKDEKRIAYRTSAWLLGCFLAVPLVLACLAWILGWQDRWLLTAIALVFNGLFLRGAVVRRFPKAGAGFRGARDILVLAVFVSMAAGLVLKSCDGRLGECVPNRFDDCR